MPLQSSGQISISQIRNELLELSTDSYSLRTLSSAAGKGTPDSFSEFYGFEATPLAPTVTSGYNDLGGNQYEFYVTINSIGTTSVSSAGVIVNGSTYYADYGGGTGTFYINGIFGPYQICQGPSYTAFATNSIGTGTSAGTISIPGNLPTANNISDSGEEPSNRQGTLTIINVRGTFTSTDGPPSDGLLFIERDGFATAVAQLNGIGESAGYPSSGNWIGGYSINTPYVGPYRIYAVIYHPCGNVTTPTLTLNF